MQIEDLKYWHWILISILLGWLMAWMRLGEDPTARGRSQTPARFERTLFQPTTGGHPTLRNITVYPPMAPGKEVFGDDPTKQNKLLTPVTFEVFTPINEKEGQYMLYSMYADYPYVPVNQQIVPYREGMGFQDFLAEIKKKQTHIDYKYAWWTEPKWTYRLWIVGSVVVIGLIWPTIINLLVGAGLGRPRKPKEDYDLSRFKSEPEPVAAKVTTDDMDKLRALEESLAASLANGEPAPESEGAAAPPPVRALNATPAPAAMTKEEREEHKQYKGEFYPVVKSVDKKKDA